MTTEQKCAHPACRCLVADDKTYCHERFEDAKDQIEISCDCAHPGCSLSD